MENKSDEMKEKIGKKRKIKEILYNNNINNPKKKMKCNIINDIEQSECFIFIPTTTDECLTWVSMQLMGSFGKYEDTLTTFFKKDGIQDAEDLAFLKNNRLKKYGIEKFADRKRLLIGIKEQFKRKRVSSINNVTPPLF
eukprot:531254_1